MKRLVLSAIMVVVLAGACGVSPHEDVTTSESALISSDPCGVQTSPYNPQCWHTGVVSSWNCQGYNSTTHQCYKAIGTYPIVGTYFIDSAYNPPNLAHKLFIWPAWSDDTQPWLPSGFGHYPAMEVPPDVQVTWDDLLPSGWAYNRNDLSPHTASSGLLGMIWDYIELKDGMGICIYSGSAFTNELGCWHVGAGGYLLVQPNAYGNVAVHSFYTFYWI